MGIFTNFVNRYSKSGRNLRRKEYAQEKRQAYHQIKSTQEAIDFRKREDPREQAALKQGMFGRGLGKSTIMDQEKDRLTLMQKNRNAALARSLQIAHKNYSLIKKRWRLGRRMNWAQSVDNVIGVAGMVLGTYGAGASAGGMGAASAGAGGATGAYPDYGGNNNTLGSSGMA